MKKIASVFLAFLMLALLAACGTEKTSSAPETGGNSTASVPSASGTASAEDSSAAEEYSLPVADYDGRTFTILQRTEYSYEFKPEDSGGTISELVEERNNKVEELYNVKLATLEVDGAWGVHEDFISYIRNTVTAASAGYDLIAGYAAILPSIVGEGQFYNWKDIENINLSADWWAQDFIDQMTLNDKLYLVTGDLSLTFWDSMTGLFFNKTLAENNNLPNLYDAVRDGEWTFDKMFEDVRAVAVNSDEEANRIYGYATYLTTQIDVYQDAFEIPVTSKDAEGKPYYTINQAKTYDALDKLFGLIVNQPFTHIAEDQDDTAKFFGKDKTLFAPLSFSAGSILREYEINYGILPLPKYNVEQENYHSTCADYYSVFAIPVTVTDTAFVGMLTEALCYESYRTVVPQYYSTILQSRYTKDEDSVEMMEIIRKGITHNFGYLYSYTLNWPGHQLNVCINAGSNAFASTWESKESSFQTNLERVISYYFDS